MCLLAHESIYWIKINDIIEINKKLPNMPLISANAVQG